eukprot:Phypoly_transcript_04725.p1 GENE.Phypoly_transcript_04725~~Phypoly_transcript_04725.p1  ORF type:complete len:622 (-),score=135.89 Phypoly_transcript_04725:251-1879(-)
MADAELTKYFDLTCNFTAFSFAVGIDLDLLKNSSSNPHKFIKYAAAALSARACGNETHFKSLISDTIRISNILEGDVSLESLGGFLLLSFLWLGMGEMKQFALSAIRVFEKMPSNHKCQVSAIQLTYLSVCKHLTSELTPYDRVKNFLNFGAQINPQESVEDFYFSVTRLFTEVFGAAAGNNLDYHRIDGLAILLSHVVFSEDQRLSILQEIDKIRKILIQQPANLYIQNFLLEYLSIFVNWRSGHKDLALKQALTCADSVSLDLLYFGSKFEGIGLLSISLFLYECNQFEKAYKLHKTASTLHSLFHCKHSLIAHCIPMFSAFLSESLAIFPPSPDEMPNDPEHIESVVSKCISLVYSFVPENDPKQLVSPHGLHVWYKAFSSLCPPQPSFYHSLSLLPSSLSPPPSTLPPLLPPSTRSSPLLPPSTLSPLPSPTSPSHASPLPLSPGLPSSTPSPQPSTSLPSPLPPAPLPIPSYPLGTSLSLPQDLLLDLAQLETSLLPDTLLSSFAEPQNILETSLLPDTLLSSFAEPQNILEIESQF